MKHTFLPLLLLTIPCAAFSQHIRTEDLSAEFEKYSVNGCFVLFSPPDSTVIRYNPGLCDTGYIPASTFKIPNSLIALEEGIIKDTSAVTRWDGHHWPVDSWNRDQTLTSAVKYSCVWYFSKLAKKIGVRKYRHYLEAFDYGNKDPEGQPERFWLAGKLRISANQQVRFLERFYDYRLPVSKRSADIVKDILVLESNGSYRLSGKTGGGMLNDSAYIMWFVGYLEKPARTYFFALNFISGDFEKTSPARFKITRDILVKLGLLD
jgi:beta-lactamase class D